MSFQNKILLLALSIVTISHSSKAQSSNLDIEQLFKKVEQNSKANLLAKQQIKIVETEIRQTNNDRLPQLSIFAAVDKASNMPVYSNGLFNQPEQHDVIHTLYSSGANLYFNIFSGFKIQNENKIAKIEAEIAETQQEKTLALVKLKAIHLFCDLYVQQQWKHTMEKDIEKNQNHLSDIKNFHKAGVVLESDVLRAELELSKRKMTLVEIENSIAVIQQSLNVLIGEADQHSIIPVISKDFTSNTMRLKDALEEANDDFYDAKLSHYHVEKSEQDIKLAKSNYSPRIGLTGSFQFSNPQIFLYPYNASWYNLGLVGLKVSYDINSLYHNKNKVTKAKQTLEAAELHHKNINDEVRTKVYEAFYANDEAIKKEAISLKNKEYADENARIIKNAYFSHTVLINDFLDANLLEIKADFELEQAKINIIKTNYSLQFAIGKL